LRKRWPDGACYNVEHVETGRVISLSFADAGDPRPGPEYRIVGGPYPDLKTAIRRARPELLYQHLLRTLLDNGILRASSGHQRVTVSMLAEWTGYSVDTIQSWLRPITSKGHRPMPRYAMRLVVHEFRLRDQSKYPWASMLDRLCS